MPKDDKSETTYLRGARSFIADLAAGAMKF